LTSSELLDRIKQKGGDMDVAETIVLNVWVGWFGFLGGTIAGIVQGMFFHEDDWLGGYGSWKRRMIRLGHISFFGIGLLNLSYGFSAFLFNVVRWATPTSWLFVVGQITMPLICYLSAIKKPFRNLFFIPVLSILIGIILFVIGGLLP